MVKEKRILIYFISFLLGLFTFLCINLIKVKADTIIAPVQYVTSDTTLYISNKKGADIQLNSTVQNSNNIDIKEIIMNINYNFKGNVIYQIELSTPTQYLINVNNVNILSSDNTCSFRGISDVNVGFPKIRFTCPYDTSYVVINLSNLSDNNITSSYNFRWNYTYLSIVNENVLDLNPVLDGQGQIKDEITDSTNTITGEINDMQQSIIDSNKETQDVIKDQFNSCKNSTNLFNLDWFTFRTTNGVTAKLENDHILLNGTSTGNVYFNFNIPSGSFDTTNPLYWHLKSDVNLSNFQIQRSNLNVINIVPTNSWSTTLINNDSSYNYSGYLYIASGITLNNVKLYISVTKEKEFIFEPFGEEICTNKLDDTNNKLDGIQGALTDNSTPDLSGLENSIGWLPPGPVDSILNLPLTMLNSLTNSLTKTCSPLNLTLPYVNKNIQIPCLSAIFAQITGVNGLWTWVGTISSILILYNYLLNLYAWVDRVLTLRAEFDEAMGADLANWGRL